MNNAAPENKNQAGNLPAIARTFINEENRFVVKNEHELSAVASLCVQIRLAPEHLIKEGKDAVMSAIMVCNALNVAYTAMQKMFYYKGNITVFGELYNALAERDANFGEKREFWIDADYKEINFHNKNLGKEWAAVCGVKPKTSTEMSFYYFTIQDAEKAGLYPATKTKWVNNKPEGKEPSPDSPWNKYTKDMLMWKARSRAYKANYSRSLMGVECFEDVREAIDARDVTPNKQADDNAKALNDII